MEKAAISIALSAVRDLLLQEARFLYGVRSDVRGLQIQLQGIQCVLDDADRRKLESKSFRHWVTQIKDIAHRAEDIILTYAVQVSSRRGRSIKQRLCRFSSILNECYSVHQIGLEISEIKSDLDTIKKMYEYGVRDIIEGGSSSDNQQWAGRAFPFETGDCFVGKEEELKQLLSLMTEEEQHRIIALWGTGGIGKTTIARKLYNHIDARHCFECFAWVCVTQKCKVRPVLEDILKQLTPQPQGKDHISTLSNIQLLTKLYEIQTAKRCMIVLDDIWKLCHWDCLKPAFLIQGSKSNILLTTRNQQVANIGYAFEVGHLNLDDGWELLQKKALLRTNFPQGDAIQVKLLERIGKEMVHKCSYLPLVISLLGRVLSTRKSVEEWELVKKNINGYLYKGKDIGNKKEIYGVLELSYEELPYYLKPCFLYMGRFVEGEIIGVNDMYRMWIAQGMISDGDQGKEDTSMDTAEVYLNELVSRCMVQVEVHDAFQGQIYVTCKLHDVMRELCLLIGDKEEFGLQILDFKGGNLCTSLYKCFSGVKTRHLAVHFSGEMGLQKEDGEFAISRDTTKYVRSLSFYNAIGTRRIEFPQIAFGLKNFKFLRVLIFVNLIFPQRKLPTGICHLIHLRYLRARACELDELPPTISNLVYLFTLDLADSKNVRVPNVLKKMHRLKHLFLPLYELGKTGSYRLRLDEGLDELETLVGFDSLVHEWNSIARMKNLRRVGAVVRDKESLSAIIDATANCEHLRCLVLTVTQDCPFTSKEDLINLKKLFACSSLHRLTIDVRIGGLLEECKTQINASKLLQLTLYKCEIEDDPMEIFGKLPFLLQLRLLENSFVGEQMKCHASDFPRLKILALSCLPNLREWKVEEGSLPLVSEIEIFHCPYLKMVPEGFRFISALQKLTILGMPKLGERVLPCKDDGAEGEDFDKIRHVPSITVYNN